MGYWIVRTGYRLFLRQEYRVFAIYNMLTIILTRTVRLRLLLVLKILCSISCVGNTVDFISYLCNIETLPQIYFCRYSHLLWLVMWCFKCKTVDFLFWKARNTAHYLNKNLLIFVYGNRRNVINCHSKQSKTTDDARPPFNEDVK